MKFTTILSVLSILTPALSGIAIERLPDGVGLKAISVPDDVSRIKKRAGGCNRDNCLRAMTARISTASQFCPSFTTAAVTATTGLGPWQTQCGSNPARVSSACSCLVPPPPELPTCGKPGAHCTLSTFITDCCETIVGCECRSCHFPNGDVNDGYCG
ncbi:hypothetical protein EYR41_008778 [Orbilia oligospora]|uniref:Uncharacterized protein n=1 Tax=Orbilia oligospora TaxID=2813651 RepID=A0A7C8TW47_ORBOL|nr:hypothetical protein TWF751_002276 [Orbilia oligospora]TGJ67208.1 hypothetical protein EYR41_008778 [Orbilia oligospora]